MIFHENKLNEMKGTKILRKLRNFYEKIPFFKGNELCYLFVCRLKKTEWIYSLRFTQENQKKKCVSVPFSAHFILFLPFRFIIDFLLHTIQTYLFIFPFLFYFYTSRKHFMPATGKNYESFFFLLWDMLILFVVY